MSGTEAGSAATAQARGAAVIILAAGKGARMRSTRPKVLHEIGGLSMLGHVIGATDSLRPERRVVVVGHGAEAVSEEAARRAPSAVCVRQEPQLGTGHAAMQARDALSGFGGDVFVLFGDTPLITPETLDAMRKARRGGAGVVVLGFEPREPGGYGRLILEAGGGLARIVEAKDATDDERAVRLCNSGVMCLDGARLFGWLDQIRDDNAQSEFYLTDVVAVARADGAEAAVVRGSEEEVLGVNARADLAMAEAAFQRRARARAMAGGATLTAPETVYFSFDTELGRDVLIEPHVVFGPGVRVADGAAVRAFSHLEDARVGSGAVVGPFARLRPGAEIGPAARVGNFVEVKNAVFGEGAKANHLAYVGDAEVRAGANVGAGVITANYDGFAKHRTQIGSGAFVGSNSVLVAPVTIGDGATVAAGSAVTQDVPDDALAFGRARQTTKPGLAARLRAALRAAKEAAKNTSGR